MHERYIDKETEAVWGTENTQALWQKTELAVIEARVNLGKVPRNIFEEITRILANAPIDIAVWKELDGKLHHDLNAFLDERRRFLPSELQVYFHQGLTSYDTEEAAFATKLRTSLLKVNHLLIALIDVLGAKACEYRYVLKLDHTHGQEAELATFGQTCLVWRNDILHCQHLLDSSWQGLQWSKLSGATGRYTDIEPELENETLRILGFKPWIGATQIMPRLLYASIAEALTQIVLQLEKVAIDFRLGARSPRPLWQEPFGKKQKGSSAMPHKKNTILTEKISGMASLAKGYLLTLVDQIKTWEERDIAQSSVERVAWPDLFHVVIHSISVMTKVLRDMKIYPDNMLLEITESCGCYASATAKETLTELLLPYRFNREDAYRIVQLAAMNAREPSAQRLKIRDVRPSSLSEAAVILTAFAEVHSEPTPLLNIKDIIRDAKLRQTEQLETTVEQVDGWNKVLRLVFGDVTARARWEESFSPEYLLRNEGHLFENLIKQRSSE